MVTILYFLLALLGVALLYVCVFAPIVVASMFVEWCCRKYGDWLDRRP